MYFYHDFKMKHLKTMSNKRNKSTELPPGERVK